MSSSADFNWPVGRRRIAIVAASAVFHLCLLIVLGWTAARPAFVLPTEARPIMLRLVQTDHRSTERSVRAASTAKPQLPAASALAVSPSSRSAAAPQPAQATAAEKIGPAPASEGVIDPRLSAMLKDVLGCDYRAGSHQTAEQKAACDRKLGEAAKVATPFNTIPENKRAFYDAVQKRSQAFANPDWAFTRQPHAIDNVHGGSAAESLVGSVLPLGAGCGLKFGPNAGKKDKRSQSDRIKQDGAASIDIGPVRCAVAIPAGSLTPEVGIKQQP